MTALCAVRLCPEGFLSHFFKPLFPRETTARLVLEVLGKAPLLTAGLHLGEDTVAVASILLWNCGTGCLQQRYSFAEGGITPYTPQC